MTIYDLQSLTPLDLEKLIHNLSYAHFPCQSDTGCRDCECHIEGDSSTYCLTNPILRAFLLKIYRKRCTDVGISPSLVES